MAVTLNGTTGIDLPAPLPVSEGGTVGTAGQVLVSQGSGVAWATLPMGADLFRVERASPWVQNIAAALGLNDVQLDQLFITASTL